MRSKKFLIPIMVLAAMSVSALAPQESFDQWEPNTQKTKYWKDLKTVPANWNVHDRKGNNSIQKTKDGILLNGLIESKHYPTTVNPPPEQYPVHLLNNHIYQTY